MSRLWFEEMCEGPNEDRAQEHDERARFHAMMAKFYRLDRTHQRAFIASFNAIRESDDGQT